MKPILHIDYFIRICILLLPLLLTAFGKQAQAQIHITGVIRDEADKKPLQGVSIHEKGTRNMAITNAKGQFSIQVNTLDHKLQFSSLGYRTMELNPQIGGMQVYMKAISHRIEAVQVQTTKRVDTEAALLEERRKAGIIQDGISAELMKRTASITVTQALQRVTGVTVTDEKYVAVRGMGDRSVIGQLNGSRLASANPDQSSIPFDLVPASLLDNVTVYKSYTPDKPADAASGIINLKTKSVPDTIVLEFIVQTGLNSNIGIGGQYNSFWNSEMGVLGTRINQKNLSQDFLNLGKQYPDGLFEIQSIFANAHLSEQVNQEAQRINALMQGFDPVLTTKYKPASPNQIYTLNFGNKYPLFKGKHTLGLILGGNYYRRKTDIYRQQLTQWSIYQGVVTGNPDVYSWRNIPNFITPNNLNMGKYQTYLENTGNETLNYGVLGGLAYRFSPFHEIAGQFLGSWGGENNASNLEGGYEYTGLPGKVNSHIYSLKQTFRTLYTYNFQGEHKFPKWFEGVQLSYAGSNSTATHNDPDYRYASLAEFIPGDPDWSWYWHNRVTNEYDLLPKYSKEKRYSSHLYALTSGYVNGYGPFGVIQAEPNGRRWRFLKEENYNYKADIIVPFSLQGTRQEIKFGGDYLFRNRGFTENHLFLPGSNYGDVKSVPLYMVQGDLDRLVSNEIIGLRSSKAGLGEGEIAESGYLYNMFKSPNNYTGYYEVQAFYGMADLKLGNKWRATGGLRFESTDMGSIVDTAGVFLDPTLAKPNEDGKIIPLVFIEPNSLYRTGFLPFYSANVIYSLKEGYMNLRGGFNSTLARPELREITNVFEYDPFQMGLVVGNPDLQNQQTQNLDFRWEWFTGKGEVLALSLFGKRIHNQLIKVFSLKTEGLAAIYPEFPAIRFENELNKGHVWGMELEAVQNLGDFWSPLQDVFLGSNLMLAQSNIVKSELRYQANKTLDRHTPRNSPLFEQAPYSINAWLNFNRQEWGADYTLTFNMVGERLVQINLLGEPDLYSQPVPMLDFVWSQNITKKLVIKGFAKNILNPGIKTVYANPGTGGLWYNKEYIHRKYKRGSEIMIGLTYNLF
ncbi:carboxypeptidase-like regulatory domain-containing protein [Sphingobacterium humi]|uniref:TonB-dependent receptor plug domain-containing protein n=1 Tax=Sphingobacterium humi TaxID=1796905 RepID=A0A6N8KZV6_9SPHI|nr:carboxypeptidase-like regulatory domain-containing protein [Sphingobacterium humi]MVZ62587.1 TonB-dependent receptor plug domain-containing protein [Sphingobacterium humi]